MAGVKGGRLWNLPLITLGLAASPRLALLPPQVVCSSMAKGLNKNKGVVGSDPGSSSTTNSLLPSHWKHLCPFFLPPTSAGFNFVEEGRSQRQAL